MAGFKGKKVFGSYKTDICPFCGKAAYAMNKAQLPVCLDHKNTEYPELRCFCGKWLEVRPGKFGTYCNCIKCGNISLSKALENQSVLPPIKKTTIEAPKPKSESLTGTKPNNFDHTRNVMNLINTSFTPTKKSTSKISSIQSEIDRLQKESLVDPLEKKCKETGIRSWKDL
jgi:hypothetical protein